MPFDLWIDKLDQLALADGAGYVTFMTGEECWLDAYNDGMTPEEAWQEELSCGYADVG
jgi:hypothetical protein